MLFALLLVPLLAHATEPEPAPAGASPPPATEPAALSDPGLETLPAALPVDANGAVAPQLPPAVALGDEPAYLAEALVRGPIARKDGAPAGVEWAVRDGSGHALGAVEFGRVAGDPTSAERLGRKRSAALVEGITLASIGTTFEMVAIGFLAGGNTNTNQGEDWLWRGTNVAVVGAFPLALCTLPTRAVRDRERWTALYYSADEADQLITAHNAQLRAKLGLPALPVPPPVGPLVAPPQAAAPPPDPAAPPPPAEDAPALPPVDTIPDAEPAPVVQ